MPARKGLRGELLNDERALTLIELLVVILILSILVAVGMGAYIGQQEKAHDSAARQQLTVAHKASRSALVFRHNRLPAPGQTADFVADLQSEEPSIAFEPGSHYPEGKVAVELVQEAGERKLILRSRSRSGNYYRLLSSADGEVERQWASEVAASEPAVNLFPFPSFELASLSGGYTQHNEYGTDKGLELTTDWASSGQTSLHWWGTGSGISAVWVRFPPQGAGSDLRPAVEPNKTYTVSLDLRVDVLPPKDPHLEIIWRGADITGRSTEGIQIHEGVQRISLTATSPANTTWASIDFGWKSGSNTSIGNNPFDIYFDSIRFSEGTDTDYFDGSFPHSSWLGTPQQSPSEREGMDETPVGGWKSW